MDTGYSEGQTLGKEARNAKATCNSSVELKTPILREVPTDTKDSAREIDNITKGQEPGYALWVARIH